ncbi:MAG: hypothetical protein D3909_05290, partial [Candidatus Electrothrix sp. ATG1]|nr:hypothetical protein [Candidatus Electrothrix sp. ATG1]
LEANLADTLTCRIGIAVLMAAVVFAFVGVKFLRSTNRVAMLDLEHRSFSPIDPKSGKARKAFPCEQLYIHMDETIPSDGDVGIYGKIMIIGPETHASPQVNVPLFHSISYENFFQAVEELEKAASWKGLIGSETWIKMYRFRE